MRYDDASQTGSSNDHVEARDDTAHLAGNNFGPTTGNLITGVGTISGSTGADMSGPGGHITAISGMGGSDTTFDAQGHLEVAGQYGTLTIDANGNYTYVRTPGSPEGVSDTFTYTLADAAGSSDQAKLVIAIGNPPILNAQGSQTVQTANGALSRVEQTRRFAILPVSWEPGGDQVTPTVKPKRQAIAALYAQRHRVPARRSLRGGARRRS